jgi:DNA-binding GntR family transcriptional regulator
VEVAYGSLKERILDNAFPPGFQATEVELAAQLGMSRTPLREALVRLEKEGLIELKPRHGMRVLPLSAVGMAEIYEILTCLESTAAERLARRSPSELELAPMVDAVAEMERRLAADDLEGWARADESFHRSLLELCGNGRLAATALAFRDQVHRARLVSLHLRPRPTRSNAEHRALLEALRRGDASRARRLHQKHRERTAKVLTRLFQTSRDLTL